MRRTLQWTGEVAITLGVIVALFVVYLLWWTGVQTAGAQRELGAELDRTAESAAIAPTGTPSGVPRLDPAPAVPAVGKPYVQIRIPALGSDWGWVVVEGVALPQLALGTRPYVVARGRSREEISRLPPGIVLARMTQNYKRAIIST